MGTACAFPVARCARGTFRSSAALCAIPHRVPLMQGDPACWPIGPIRIRVDFLLLNPSRFSFSKGQFNVSGHCCRNVVVDQQDTNALIESTNWCRSNRHVGIYRMALNSKDHLQVSAGCSKRERNNCWRLLRALFAVFLILNWHMYT